MNQINYPQLAGAYKGAFKTLTYSLVAAKIVDVSKVDVLKIYLLEEIKRIETTYN